jgi:hypothetical protein
MDSGDVTLVHDIARRSIDFRSEGRQQQVTHGALGNNDIVDPSNFNTFVNYEPKAGQLDLRPGPRSAVAGARDQHGAPPVGISGHCRVPPIDIGAFAR